MNLKNWQVYGLSLLPLVGGTLVGLATGGSAPYTQLAKPPLSPPGIVFPLVWTVLYILMGVGFYLAWQGARERHIPVRCLLFPYLFQLIWNLAWPFLFFSLQLYWLASLWILALIPAVLLMIFRFWPASRTAAKLQIPYLIWCYFAVYLSFGTAALNG